MIIDFHTHCFPDAIAEKALPLVAEKGGVTPASDGKISGLLASMKQFGIDYSVILQIATKPTQNHTVNTWAIERNEPGIVAFGSVHPRSEDWEPELERLAEAGIKGVKLHPEYQSFYVDDPIMLPIYRKIAELGLIVVFHAGEDPGYPPPVHLTPERILRVADVLPQNRTVLAHMGSRGYLEDVAKLLKDTEFYYDTAFCYEEHDPSQMVDIILEHGYEKILMASDSPWESQGAGVDTINRLALTSEQRQAILGENAARLLGIANCTC